MTLLRQIALSRIVAPLAFGFAIVTGLSGCGSNPDAPGIRRVFFDDGTVLAGATDTLYVEIFLEAEDRGGDTRQSNPFSLVITLPPGVSYVPGTSAFSFQSVREPNATGSCGDGRTFLNYDFAAGEVDNSYDFEDFADDLGVQVLVTLAADGRMATASSSAAPIPDPCGVPADEEAEFKVEAS